MGEVRLLVGKNVKKEFVGVGVISGTVQSYNPFLRLFQIVYEDGRSEEIGYAELALILLERTNNEDQDQIEINQKDNHQQEQIDDSTRSPKKKLRGNHSTCTIVSSSTGEEITQLETLEKEVRKCGDLMEEEKLSIRGRDVRENEGQHPLELDLNVLPSVDDLGENEANNNNNACFDGDGENLKPENGSIQQQQQQQQQPKHCFDINAALNEEEEEEETHIKERDFVDNLVEGVKEEFSTPTREPMVELTTPTPKVKGSENMVVNMGDTGGTTYEGIQTPDKGLGNGNDSQDVPEEHSRRRKRRKLVDKPTVTPPTSLRRSTRRASSISSSLNNTKSSIIGGGRRGDDALFVSDKASSGSNNDGLTVQSHLPPKLELPPSSTNLNVGQIYILDLFSVYSFLRSFSTLLFLSPFDLEIFVEALKCNSSNSLIDSIHYSLLQILKSHLEFLSNEGSKSASVCLRSLNWDLLDVVTWPIYLIEYLLIRGSGLKPDREFDQLKLLISDYYKESPALKIEVLRCLCDDVMESETIRVELNRRTQAAEVDVDVDRIVNAEINKKRKDQMDDAGASCLTQEVADETTDLNSDECCLCKMDGNLICCDGCPAAYHTKCVGVVKDQLPEGEWYCPECLVNRNDPVTTKFHKSFRGAEPLGVDPYGRLYFSCCGYLLVLNSCEPESSYYYYHRNDLKAVIGILNSSNILYGSIISAISIKLNIPVGSTGVQDHQNSRISTICRVLELNSQVSPLETTQANFVAKPYETFSETNDHLIPINSSIANYECFAGMSRTIVGSEGHQKTRVDYSNGYTGTSNKSETLEETHSIDVECSLQPTNCDVKPEKNIGTSVSSLTSVVNNTGKGAPLKMQFDPANYVNYYGFARIAVSVALELIHREQNNIKEDPKRPSDEIISAQTKTLFRKSTNFCWLNVNRLHKNQPRESCGWCIACRFPIECGDCLFNSTREKPTPELSNCVSAGFRSKRVGRSHLYAIICHIVSIEERLAGLLLGPWQDPDYSKSWHRSILNATDVTLVKHLLLTLESNLRRDALLTDWLKLVDNDIMGSASHVLTTPVQVPTSKHVGGRKRIKLSDAETNSASITASRSGILWWRGGRVSRQLFNCKVLPHSLASKGARQAGWRKIPGIFYPEGIECAKRSKCIAWRAAVEMSTSLAHLACQVREFDSNIRWDDLENTQDFSHLSKESRKLMKLFKKVTIRRKRVEGSNVKYLLDFGKRRTIPNIVTRHGVMLEVSASERKKYWLDESLVPLHILKVYEERKLARVSIKVKPGMLAEGGKTLKRFSRKSGLSHLLSREVKSDYYQCGHCKKDVLIREAVTCRDCEGYFHRRHVRKSDYTSTAECTYTCHRCQDTKFVKKPVKPKPKKKNVQLQKSKKILTEGRPRRSMRKVKYVYAPVKSKKRGGKKKGKNVRPKKGMSKKSKQSKKGICWHKGRRTPVYHAYWLNGLRLTRKSNDARVVHFTEGKLILPHSSAQIMKPICSLCCEGSHRSQLIYVNCETCHEWFHGEAFGLTPETSSSIIGFHCHKCRKRKPPTCPYLQDGEVEKVELHEEKNNVGDKRVKNASVIEDFPRKDTGHTFPSGENSQGSIHGCESVHKDQKKEDGVSEFITEEQKIHAISKAILKEQKGGEIFDVDHEMNAHEFSNLKEQSADKRLDSTHEQMTNGISDSKEPLLSTECKDKLEKGLESVQGVGEVSEVLAFLLMEQKEETDTTPDLNHT